MKKLLIALVLFAALPLYAQTKPDETKTSEKPEVQLTAAQLDAVSGEYVDARVLHNVRNRLPPTEKR